ncbi:16S rRNA (guanine(966)-N(2))-methyltransferase RsmD [Chitinimonas sp. BJB300]|uniref:16S rRNA (guanine(966)-N(2))-methyltransferase RsmD n=1 Tax=Chitinimonas sp. BJB300 TaxID=1559339 RepID=UPI000C108639|nr:16S rRNA (guanine(966)-N(2))-methyltransferase RsmD [Chitinimonas sp. BJB300]PHV13430.1 16S rRNA (guanine(966)-N(2))-methyltransferase RsmD [Chitinimonas sp. BJB300]TSJ89747.1 16S rRNA (guanine(966)-N(2))-methyltransferase RsmD [Chitinimonas sp. BJB300]
MPKLAPKTTKPIRGTNQLRIIGGDYRRRILPFPDGEGLRPTPDRVRETLFNWLGQDLDGRVCLDLFAGSGALGFEAASRGARRVVMVEMARPALAALQSNRALLQAEVVEVVGADALAWLGRSSEQFDVVFLDPPFASDFLVKVLAVIAPCLHEDGLVYIETADWPALTGWEVLRKGKAGVVHYGLLRLTPVVHIAG